MNTDTNTPFKDLSLSPELLRAIDESGYTTPSPIQSMTIPHLLEGKDVLGQAQTGTGKTAAFALPILQSLDLQEVSPQVLVLAPTRELAMQVSEAFSRYGKHLPRLKVQAIYGGQDYSRQIKNLNRGVHIVVGTPGRVMDHIRRKTLKLNNLKTLVLDEADEMLRMGFLEDVEWILNLLPEGRQTALFSATMPGAIQRIAEKYLDKPEVVRIQSKSTTADTVRQRFWVVRRVHKLDALTRILEAESHEGVLAFVRTKAATLELAEKLKARGFKAEALNGDMVQNQREKTIALLKNATLDIVVATDVAARGLDVERVTHVINYDVPFDPEAYVHRIGRTGRAGKSGEAILFVSPREQRMLRVIERATKNRIEEMDLPTKKDVADKRRKEFKEKLTQTLESKDLESYAEMVVSYIEDTGTPLELVTAALAKMAQGDRKAFVSELPQGDDVREIKAYRKDRSRGRRGQDRPRKGQRFRGAKRKDDGGKESSNGGGKKKFPKKPFGSKGKKSYGSSKKSNKPRTANAS